MAANNEKYSIKWNDYHSNISASFRSLREEEDFYDVTLVSDDIQISAHKVILSACSSFFKTILKRNPHQHPLIYLTGVSADNLSSIIDYIYNGEVDLHQAQIITFLDSAKKFEIQGLMSKDLNVKEEAYVYEQIEETLFQKYSQNLEENDKRNQNETKKVMKIEDPNDHEEIDAKITELVTRIGKAWTCKTCGKITRDKTNLRSHIEVHLEGLSFPCSICDKSFRTRITLATHKSKTHRTT